MDFLKLMGEQNTTMAFVAFAFLYVADILLGLTNNVLIRGEAFEWKRLADSLIKVLVGALVLAALILATYLLESTSLDVSDEAVGLASLAAYVTLFWNGYRESLAGIYQKLREMFSIKGGGEENDGQDDALDRMGSDENEVVYEFKDGGGE